VGASVGSASDGALAALDACKWAGRGKRGVQLRTQLWLAEIELEALHSAIQARRAQGAALGGLCAQPRVKPAWFKGTAYRLLR
jgi:hypothetical protein